MQRIIDAEKSDIFAVLAYVAFALQPKTRGERARKAKTTIHRQFSDKQQAFLDFVLDHYVQEGVEELDQEKLTPLLILKYEALSDATKDLGSPDQIRGVFLGFQRYLYEKTAGM